MPMPLLKLAASVAVCPAVMLAGAAAKLSMVAVEPGVYAPVAKPTPQDAAKTNRIRSTVCRNMGDLR